MNVYEMEGFLRGKCLPGDLLAGESHVAYLVRKLNEASALKAERDAQQKRADALAVENAALKKAVTEFNELYGQGMNVANWHLNGDLEPLDNFFDENDWNPETPATSAALAAIEALGVEKAIAHLLNKFEGTGQIGVPVMALESLAKQMLEAK
jgi:hypothetical protein